MQIELSLRDVLREEPMNDSVETSTCHLSRAHIRFYPPQGELAGAERFGAEPEASIRTADIEDRLARRGDELQDVLAAFSPYGSSVGRTLTGVVCHDVR